MNDRHARNFVCPETNTQCNEPNCTKAICQIRIHDKENEGRADELARRGRIRRGTPTSGDLGL